MKENTEGKSEEEMGREGEKEEFEGRKKGNISKKGIEG